MRREKMIVDLPQIGFESYFRSKSCSISDLFILLRNK